MKEKTIQSIRKKMSEKGIKLTELAAVSGCPVSTLCDFLKNGKPIAGTHLINVLSSLNMIRW